MGTRTRSASLITLRALPFAWELRLEDANGVERVMTVHHGAAASTGQAVTDALHGSV